jgi:hypothetical protein
MKLQEILQSRNEEIYNRFVIMRTPVEKLAQDFKLTTYHIKSILRDQRVLDNIKFNGRLKS